MAKRSVEAFAARYVADLIESYPPNEADLAGELFTFEDREALRLELRRRANALMAAAEKKESD